ncbi:hypothetical protein AB0C96_02990 [Streptomyces sp. NPDC048506]|uniref:hypothetical protein n=1 Tax=Streptomyces sp. NPDC048506 TaxID=3155028 RepID=UPI00343E5F54
MRQRVPFSDVDMDGHVHNGVYCSSAETAINGLLPESAREALAAVRPPNAPDAPAGNGAPRQRTAGR